MNVAQPGTIDPRVINTRGTLNVHQKTENQNLALNSAKSIGCQIVGINSTNLFEGPVHPPQFKFIIGHEACSVALLCCFADRASSVALLPPLPSIPWYCHHFCDVRPPAAQNHPHLVLAMLWQLVKVRNT